MKLFLSPFLLALVVALPGIWSQCTIDDSVAGSTSVVFTLYPSPADVLAKLPPGIAISPVDIVNLLQPPTNVVNALINSIVRVLTIPFGKVPSCNFYWSENKIFCSNVNAALPLIKLACSLLGNVTNVSVPVVIPRIPFLPPTTGGGLLLCEGDVNGRPWGINKVNATGAQALGFGGQGVVVANIDTGVRYTHVELAGKMRPTYSWLDPYNLSPNVMNDIVGHGTHTMATMIGNTVGVAPNATFIACRGCTADSCTEEALTACGQWLACPDKKDKNCTTRPDVINNSWGGGTGDTSYNGVLAVWNKMGIASFFASGNTGPTCSSVTSPADGGWSKYAFLSVGATACDDSIASFSGNGPSLSPDNPGGLGVQIVGPGRDIRSAWNGSDTDYNTISGTSMSSPHLGGAAAAVLSKNHGLTPTQLDAVLMNSAWQNPLITNNTLYCTSSMLSNGGYPNNVYGYGRLDVSKAVQSA